MKSSMSAPFSWRTVICEISREPLSIGLRGQFDAESELHGSLEDEARYGHVVYARAGVQADDDLAIRPPARSPSDDDFGEVIVRARPELSRPHQIVDRLERRNVRFDL